MRHIRRDQRATATATTNAAAAPPRRSKLRSVMGVSVAGFFVMAALPTMADAASSVKDVIVSNDTNNPVPTKAVGTTPVSGSVNVANLPASQTVNGTVNVGNLPAVQSVKGTVGIDPAANTVQTQPTLAYTTKREVSTQAWSSWAAGYGFTYNVFAELTVPDGKQLQARWMSASVTPPDPACTTTFLRVTQLGNDGGAGSFSPATKTGPDRWVGSDEVLVPKAKYAVAGVHCPDGTVVAGKSVYLEVTVSGDLFPA